MLIHLAKVLNFSLIHLKKGFDNFFFVIFKLIQMFVFVNQITKELSKPRG